MALTKQITRQSFIFIFIINALGRIEARTFTKSPKFRRDPQGYCHSLYQRCWNVEPAYRRNGGGLSTRNREQYSDHQQGQAAVAIAGDVDGEIGMSLGLAQHLPNLGRYFAGVRI